MTLRPTPVRAGEDHLVILDQLRGLAILLVFLFHCYLTAYAGATPPSWSNFPGFATGHPSRWLLFPLASGWVGVPVFFVLSGFCIHLSHSCARDKSWRTYFIRRFFRIYPPYLVALLFFAFILPVSRLAFHGHAPREAVILLTHLTLTHNFVPASIFRINGSFWTIAVEVQLYALYPLLLALVRRAGWNGCLLLTLLLEIVLMEAPRLGGPWYLSVLTKGPLAYWFTWVLGARIADDWLARRPIFLNRIPCGTTLAAFILASLISDRDTFAFLFGAVAAANFIARSLCAPGTRCRFPTAPFAARLRALGLMSYSVYLLHEPFIELLAGLPGPEWLHHPLPLLALGLAEGPLVLILAWAFHRAIELPSMAWGRRFDAGAGTPPVASARR